jgi:hypothetical protein
MFTGELKFTIFNSRRDFFAPTTARIDRLDPVHSLAMAMGQHGEHAKQSDFTLKIGDAGRALQQSQI